FSLARRREHKIYRGPFLSRKDASGEGLSHATRGVSSIFAWSKRRADADHASRPFSRQSGLVGNDDGSSSPAEPSLGQNGRLLPDGRGRCCWRRSEQGKT